MGQEGRGRQRPACRYHHFGCATHQGTGARGQGASPGQRHPEDGQRVFRAGGARPPIEVLKSYIDRHRDDYGVEPICRVLQMAPSCYCKRCLNTLLTRRTGGSQTSTTWRSRAKPTRQWVPSPGSIVAVRLLMRTMVPTTVCRYLSSKATFSPHRKSLRVGRGTAGGSGASACGGAAGSGCGGSIAA